jgi:hypothetical protein
MLRHIVKTVKASHRGKLVVCALALFVAALPAKGYTQDQGPRQRITREAGTFASAMALLTQARSLPVSGPADFRKLQELLDRADPGLKVGALSLLAQEALNDSAFTKGLDEAMAKTAPAELVKRLNANPEAAKTIGGYASAASRVEGKEREIAELMRAVASKIHGLKKSAGTESGVPARGDGIGTTVGRLVTYLTSCVSTPVEARQIEGAIALVVIIFAASAYAAAKSKDFIPEPQHNNTTPFVRCVQRCDDTAQACLAHTAEYSFERLECKAALLSCEAGCMFLPH